MVSLSKCLPEITRRGFVGKLPLLVVSGTGASVALDKPDNADLVGQLGVTTGSFTRHLSTTQQTGKLRLIDLPRFLRDELDMGVIDLMTATLPSIEHSYLQQLRAASELAGCTITNLKMNQRGLELGSERDDERRRAIDEYKRSIQIAAILGARWVRPLPRPKQPNLKVLASSYRELIDFAAPQGITVLIENFGWLASDPDAIPDLIAAVGSGLAAQPDTGNWTDNAARYAGLAKAFPLAKSCDFKARNLGTKGEHEAYDLKRCFEIGWHAGFRGPWCFEYLDDTLEGLQRGLMTLRNHLRAWMANR